MGDPADAQRNAGEWRRTDVFGEKFSMKSLGAYVDAVPDVAWEVRNPYRDRPKSELLQELLGQPLWRHHHGIPELRSRETLYTAYADRVDDMLEMVDTALDLAGVDAANSSFLDLGTAEGYVVNHLLDRGVRDVDAVELGALNIERMWKVRAVKGIDGGRVGRVDLQHVAWSRSLGRRYDVTLALGVIYHMENPLLFARNLYEATERVAIIESDTPVFPGNARFRGFGNMYLYRDQVTVSDGDVRHITEMRPDRQALAELLLEAGFSRVRVVDPPDHGSSRYFATGEKTVVVADV